MEAGPGGLEALEGVWRPLPGPPGGPGGPLEAPAAGLQKILPVQEDGNSVGVPFSIEIHQWPEGC